jgi:hypothetical protein
VVTKTKLLTVAQQGAPRAAVLRDLLTQVASLEWLDGPAGRAVLHVGASGRSTLAAETALAVAAMLRERAPSLRLEVLDPAEVGGEWNGVPRLVVDREDTVQVQGPRGIAVRVPRFWFESFFLVTVAAVHPDRRWRIAGVLQAQAEILAYLNPGMASSVLLAEAHRLGASDLAIACGSHPTDGDWWVASPNDLLVDGSVARAAGIDPRDLPSIRTIARHELVESWEATAPAPELSSLAHGAGTARVLAAREQSVTAVRRTLEDARLVSRNLRKVPQALRRRLAARSGKRESA